MNRLLDDPHRRPGPPPTLPIPRRQSVERFASVMSRRKPSLTAFFGLRETSRSERELS